MSHVRICSVSELLSLLSTKNIDELSNGLRILIRQLEEGPIAPLSNYLASEPSMPQILKLLPTIMQSSNHDYMCSIISLVRISLDTLGGILGLHSAAVEAAKIIINNHIKVFYRCFSSGNSGCVCSAFHLLTGLCQLGTGVVSLFVNSFDWSHPGLIKSAKVRKITFGNSSPRECLIDFYIVILKHSDYDSKVQLGKYPTLLHDIIDGLKNDSSSVVTKVLEAIKEFVVFNENENRNLAISFIKSHQMISLAGLLNNKLGEVVDSVKKFILDCFGTDGKGLCYAVGDRVSVLRNRLLLDFISNSDLIKEMDFFMPLLVICPDVSWSLLASSRSLSLDPNNSSRFLHAISLVIQLLQHIPTEDTDALIPKSINRAILTRGINHEDSLIQLNSLLLLLTLLQRLSRFKSIPDPSKLATKMNLPDFRTIYNFWKNLPESINAEDDENLIMMENCYLEILYFMIKLGLHDPLCSSNISANDIWTPKFSSELMGPSTLRLLSVLDPINLLQSEDSLKIMSKLIQQSNLYCQEETHELLSCWIRKLEISQYSFDQLYAMMPDCINQILTGIREIYFKPLIFSHGQDPLSSYLGINEKLTPAEDLKVAINNVPEKDESLVNMPKRRKIEHSKAPDLKSLLERISGDDPVHFLNSILSLVRRKNVIESLSAFDPNLTAAKFKIDTDDVESFVTCLTDRMDHLQWINQLASAFTHSNKARIDLRLLVDSGVLGICILGFSLNDDLLRKTCHFILTEFLKLAKQSRVKERRQIMMVLESFSQCLQPEEPIQLLPRLTCFFYAESLSMMLQPEHPLYRPLIELYLSNPVVNTVEVFLRLFFDANDEWSREIYWVLSMIDRALGKDGQYVELCPVSSIHLADNMAVLAMDRGIDEGTKVIAERLLKKCSTPWTMSFNNIRSNNS